MHKSVSLSEEECRPVKRVCRHRVRRKGTGDQDWKGSLRSQKLLKMVRLLSGIGEPLDCLFVQKMYSHCSHPNL